MMKLHNLFFYFILLIGGSLWGFYQFDQPLSQVETNKEISYLALGDSYTVGEAVNQEESFPYQLMAQLKNQGYNTTSAEVIAETGWRTDELLKKAKRANKKETYDLVSLLIGVNNEYQGQTVEEFEPEFRACLQHAIDHATKGNKGVFVLSIPDYAYTPFGKENKKISKRINEFNAVCARIAREKKVKYIDITAISRNGLNDPSFVASDGLHPSAIQYKIWVNSFISEVVQLLK